MDNNWRRAEKSEKMPRSDEAAAKKSPKSSSAAGAGKQLAKTFAFLPIDGHGHVNAMIGLADQLRQLGHRTVFICNDSSSAKHFGHELVLVRSANSARTVDDSGAAAALYDDRTASKPKQREQEIIMSEEKIFTGDERLNSKWAQMVDLLDLNVNKPECVVKSLAHNYGLLRLTIEAEIIPLDERIETILIDLRPDLVVVDQLTPIPAIHRLCAASASASAASGSGIGIGNGPSSINLGGAAAAAGRRAGSSGGGGESVVAESKQQQQQEPAKRSAKSQQKPHRLRWISLCSCNPMPLYHDHSLANGEHQFPPPLMGLSARMDSGVELEVEQLRYERCLSSSGILGALARLASMAKLGGAALSEQDFRRFCRNESPWLNLYMYPAALDYEGERCGRAHLPRDRYHRLDCLIRAPKELSREEQASLRQLEDWRNEIFQERREKATARRGEEPSSNSSGRQRKTMIVYVSLGTTMSLNLRLMEALLGQVFACLEAGAHYRFVVSLGARAHLLSSSSSSSSSSEASKASSIGEKLERWRCAGRLLVAAWWPQPELMRRKLIDAAVVHGGNNTICELVHFGITALVVVPAFHDQLDNARRVADLAMGVALPATELLERGPSDSSLLRCALNKSVELSQQSAPTGAARGAAHSAERWAAAAPHGQQRDARYCARLLEAKLASWQSLSSD